EQAILRLGELQHQQASAGLEHAQHGTQRQILIGNVAQAEGDGNAVESIVGEGQVLGIRLGELDVASHAAVDEPVPTDIEHGFVDISQHDQPFAAHPPGELVAQITGAASDVQHLVSCPHGGDFDSEALPQTVDAAGHEVVHEVVFGGHGMEYVSDACGFLFNGDFFKTKVGGFFLVHSRVQDGERRKQRRLLYNAGAFTPAEGRKHCAINHAGGSPERSATAAGLTHNSPTGDFSESLDHTLSC